MPARTAKGSTKKTILDHQEYRIRLLLGSNPKRVGTASHRKYALLRDGMLVSAFLALQGHYPDLDKEPDWPVAELRWCLKKGWVTLEPPA